jgi:hypothetical protein
MIIHSVVANQNGMFETLNGYGVNMNSIIKATKVIMNSKLEVKLGQLMMICPQLSGKVLNQNERKLGCKCLQNNKKG